MGTSNTDNLKAAVKLVANLVSDIIKSEGDATAVGKMGEFTNLIPQVMALLPQVGTLSLSNLSSSDYVALVQELATDLSIPDAHSAAVVNAACELIEKITLYGWGLVNALKAAPSTASPAQPTT